MAPQDRAALRLRGGLGRGYKCTDNIDEMCCINQPPLLISRITEILVET